MTENPGDLFYSALQDAQSGRFAEAEEKLRRLLDEPLNGQDAAAVRGMLGAVYASLGNHQAAVEHLTSAASQHPADAMIASNLSISLREIGRLDEAIAAGKKATTIEPRFADAHCNLGVALKAKGDLDAAAASYRRALEIRPDFVEAQNNLGVVLKDKGDSDGAIASYKRALEIRPSYAEAHNNLGVALKDTGDLDGAIASYHRALEIRPSYAEAHNNLGVALKDKGDPDGAIASYHRALEIRPAYAEAHNNLAVALLEKGDFEGAITSCRRALELRPDYVEAHSNLGIAYKNLGRLKDAIACQSKALAIKPDLPEAHDNLCELHERSNDIAAFEMAVENARLVCGKDDPKILLRQAQLASRKENFEEALSCLEGIQPERFNREYRSIYFGLLGETYDRLGRFDQAFSAFCALNALAKDTPKYQEFDADRFVDAVTTKRDAWRAGGTPHWLRPDAGAVRSEPVFLIGFPRSGTTLLDTILRSHPQISVVEEMPMVDKMRAVFGRPESIDALSHVSEAEVQRMRDAYTAELERQIDPSERDRVIVDKYPLNITSVGLIHRVFPDAKFVFLLRHPCDCVLSCFIRDFEPNDAMANFLSLERTADLYAAVMELWQAYGNRLNLEVQDLRYEDLVQDLEGTCRPLIEFLGLDWDSNLHNYRETALAGRAIKTPSYSQVVKPLYSRAIGRWMNYEDQLKPVLPVLEPWIEAFHYDS